MTQTTREIPVHLAPPRPGSSADFAGRAPVIEVHVANDPNWSTDATEPPKHNGRLYLAMIDTGADSYAIDAALASELNATSVKSVVAHGWVGTDTKTDAVRVQIFIPRPVNVVLAVEAAVRDFRGAGQQWDILLGRSFLQRCRLIVEGPRSAYSLTWIG